MTKKSNEVPKDKVLWAFIFRTHQRFNPKPVKMRWNSNCCCWVNKQGTDYIDGHELVCERNEVYYTHTDKKKVEVFIEGFSACREVIRDAMIVDTDN